MAKMMVALLSVLDVIRHVRAFLVPVMSPVHTLGIQQVHNKYL